MRGTVDEGKPVFSHWNRGEGRGVVRRDLRLWGGRSKKEKKIRMVLAAKRGSHGLAINSLVRNLDYRGFEIAQSFSVRRFLLWLYHPHYAAVNTTVRPSSTLPFPLNHPPSPSQPPVCTPHAPPLARTSQDKTQMASMSAPPPSSTCLMLANCVVH